MLEQVRASLDAGWPPGLTLLTGDDRFHLERARREILAALVPGGAADFGLTVYDDERVPLGDVLSSARSLGMFAERRVVDVRDLDALEGGAPDKMIEAIEGYARNPPRGSHLLIRAASLDGRRKLHKAIVAASHTFVFRAPQESERREVIAAVRAAADRAGVSLDGDVPEFLVDAVGLDMGRIATEIDKLATWSRGGQAVTLDDARDLVSGGGVLSGWEIAEALGARDVGAAVAAARRLVASGAEPLQLLGGIAWLSREMLRAKSGGGGRRAPWRASRAAERFRVDELLRFPSILAAADHALKSRSIEPGAVLERAVSRLIAP